MYQITSSPCLTFNLRKAARKIYIKISKENGTGGKPMNKKVVQVKGEVTF